MIGYAQAIGPAPLGGAPANKILSEENRSHSSVKIESPHPRFRQWGPQVMLDL
jgi:hypothetical protein